MGTFFVYIIKSAICLIIFYLFYKLLLSKDTFHRFNRIALLSLLLLSFVVPLIEISLSPSSQVKQPMVMLEDFVMQVEPVDIVQAPDQEAVAETSHLWIIALIVTYMAGIILCFSRQLWSLLRMFKLMDSCRKETMGLGVTIFVYNKQIAPFSWMKYIIISEKDLEENGKEILSHELAHIHNKHSWDLIVAEICIFFQWFNPAAWLLKQELQSIHEFEADEVVLNQGIDAKQYQLLIIKKAVGTRLYSMANSLNHSSLKKRITMMLKEKSNPWARLKYLYVLPLACVTMLAFARPDVSSMEIQSADKINEISGYNNSAEVKNADDQQLSVAGELLAQNDGKKTASPPPPPLKSTVKFPATVVSGKVISSTDKQGISSVSVIEVEPSGRFVYATITKDDGTFELDVKNSDNKLKFSHIGFKSIESPIKETGIIQMDEVTRTISETVVVGYAVSTENNEDKSPKQDKFTLVEQMPQFPGGEDALMKYIIETVRYPTIAKSKGIEGRVVCSCVVNAEGRVTDVKVVSSVDPVLDNEAKRVVENMPNWIPGKQNGKSVPMNYTIPIVFKISK